MPREFDDYEDDDFSPHEKRLSRAAQRRHWQKEVALLLEEEEEELRVAKTSRLFRN